MTRGTTSGGFAFEFDESRLDDMRFVDVLAVVTDETTSFADRFAGASRLVEMLLGKEQKKALYEHIGKKHEGRVPRAEFERALYEIMQAGAEPVGGKDAVKN